MSADAQLIRYVHIAFIRCLATLLDGLHHITSVVLPHAATVWARHVRTAPTLRRSPGIKALLVDVLTASSATIDDCLATLSLEFAEANGAVAFDGLSVLILCTVGGLVDGRGVGEDLLEFGCEEGKLVGMLEFGAEDPGHDIEPVLALVTGKEVRTGARGTLGNFNGIDVARGTSQLDFFFWNFIGAASSSLEYIESLRQSSVVDVAEV